MTELAKLLRSLREEKNLTQEQLAKGAKIPYDTYRKYEMNQTRPRVDHLIRLAEYHNCSIYELLGIGKTVTLTYDKQKIEDLRSALTADLPPKVKAERIDEALAPLLRQRDKALTIPESIAEDTPFLPGSLTEFLLESGVETLKTIRFNVEDDHLVLSAANERYNLLMSEGLKYDLGGTTTYNINGLTIDDVRKMIAVGDDTHDNQIRVTQDGQVYLSQDIVGAESIGNLRFRFETFDAGDGYVGPDAAADDEYIKCIYRNLIGNWKDGKWGTYVNVFDY